MDFDSATGQWLPPLDLNSREVLIGQGLAPSERDVRSHQQMVYAVSMRVLETFERGFGRSFDWQHRLRLLPHAYIEGNAHFDPDSRLIFGYFDAAQPDPASGILDGQRIFTSLSYDVVAHEVCHPVMLGVRPTDLREVPCARCAYDENTDLEIGAFHEGMADLIALLVRFASPASSPASSDARRRP